MPLKDDYTNGSSLQAADFNSLATTVNGLSTDVPGKQPKFMTGTCDTASATAAKTVTLDSPWNVNTPVTGDWLLINFSLGSNVSSPTLAVNGGIAYPIRTPSNQSNASNTATTAGYPVLLYFTGSIYVLSGSTTNTIYSESTALEIVDTASATTRLISGRRAEDLMVNEATKARTLENKTLASPILSGTSLVNSTAAVDFYNTADTTTNYERAKAYWNNNTFTIVTQNGGTGTLRGLTLNGAATYITLSNASTGAVTMGRGPTATTTIVNATSAGLVASAGVQTMMAVTPTVNQTSTAGYTALLVNATETATGSGTKRLISAQVGGIDEFVVDNNGNVTAAGTMTAAAGTATGSVVTVDGTQTLEGKTIKGYTESVVALGTVGAASTLAITAGTVLTATLTASTATTFTMPAVGAGKSFTLMLKQAAATGNGTATFTGVKWPNGGTAPTVTATAAKMDIFSFFSDGTNWYGSAAQNYTP